MKKFDINNTKKYRINGWDLDDDFLLKKLKKREMISLVTETTNLCNYDCEYCYTAEFCSDPKFHNKELPEELNLKQRLSIIDQGVKLGAVTYEIVGAGEPLLDKHFLHN